MKRILAVQLKPMGELLLTTPSLAALRAHHPEAHITLAIDSGCRELLPAFSSIDDNFIFSRKDGNRDFWRKLIFTSFDACLDFTANDRSAICSALSKSKLRATFETGSKSPLKPIFYNTFISSSPRTNHLADHYQHLLKAVDIAPGDVSIRLDPPEWAEKKAGQLLDETGVHGPFVLLHPGATRPEKYWLPERWAEVIDFCNNDLALPCVVTGARDTSAEAGHIKEIRSKIGFHDLTGRADLLTLAALARRAWLLLSVDSVAMHFGAAFETRQVALFGRTNPFFWRPRHENAAVVQAGSPGTNPVFSPRHRGASMSEISTEQAIDAIRLLMKPVTPHA